MINFLGIGNYVKRRESSLIVCFVLFFFCFFGFLSKTKKLTADIKLRRAIGLQIPKLLFVLYIQSQQSIPIKKKKKVKKDLLKYTVKKKEIFFLLNNIFHNQIKKKKKV